MGRGQSPSAFNMSGLTGALPDYQSSTPGQMSHHDQQRILASSPGAAATYQSQPSPGQSMNYSAHPSQFPSAYQHGYSPQPHSAGPSPIHPSFSGGAYFPTQHQQYMYYPGQYGQPVQPQQGPFPSAYGLAPTHGYSQQGTDISSMGGGMAHSVYSPGAPQNYAYGSGGTFLRPGSMPGKLSSERPMPTVD